MRTGVREGPSVSRKAGNEVAAIETRSLPSSLAAAHRGFTFYLADPSARLTPIAKAVESTALPFSTAAQCELLFAMTVR